MESSRKLLTNVFLTNGNNGVKIVLTQDVRGILVQVNRESKRVSIVKTEEVEITINVLSIYTPQIECEEDENVQVWSDLGEELNAITG